MGELLALLITIFVVLPIVLSVSAYIVAMLLFFGISKLEEWTKNAHRNPKDDSDARPY